MLSAERDFLCRSRRGRAVLFVRGVFGIDALTLLVPLASSARTTARLAAESGLALSPAMEKLLDAPLREGDTAPEEAWLALSRLRTVGTYVRNAERDGEGRARIYAMLDRLASLPPLCARRIVLDLRGADLLESAAFDENFWGALAFCLAAFLCRGTSPSPIQLTLAGTAAEPVLLLRADSPLRLPAGGCRLSVLAGRFPEAAELSLAAAFALRQGIAVEAYADGEGNLGFSCYARRTDPSLLGLKQPIGFSGEEAEAKEAEWCRLLLAFAREEKLSRAEEAPLRQSHRAVPR